MRDYAVGGVPTAVTSEVFPAGWKTHEKKSEENRRDFGEGQEKRTGFNGSGRVHTNTASQVPESHIRYSTDRTHASGQESSSQEQGVGCVWMVPSSG